MALRLQLAVLQSTNCDQVFEQPIHGLVSASAGWLRVRQRRTPLSAVGIIALVVGCTCLLCAVGFFALVNLMPRRTGDLAFLSWNQP